MPSLTSMAEVLLAQAKQIDAYLESNHLPYPSFDSDVLADLPSELQNMRMSLANNSDELKKLTQGPVASTMELAFSWTHLLFLRVIYHYRLAHAVPLEGTASYAEIAAQSGLHEDLVFRFLRAAMGHYIFDESPITGRVRHTASSRLLVTNRGYEDSIGLETAELGPAYATMIDSWNKWGQDVSEPNQTAFAILNDGLPIFEVLANDPERRRRFGSAMQFFTSGDRWDLRHLLNAFDWTALDRHGTRVVDVGGGNGQVSLYLARHTEHINFLVQDLAQVVSAGTEQLAAVDDHVKERVEFVAHDFLRPQTLDHPPDVFLLRWILHNWSDAYCVRIIRSLVPAMRAGTKVLIFEYVLEDGPMRGLAARSNTQVDMIMAACFGGRERRRLEFEKLLAHSDERFVLESIRHAEGSAMGLVEVGWKS